MFIFGKKKLRILTTIDAVDIKVFINRIVYYDRELGSIFSWDRIIDFKDWERQS